jgi:hypothetical protein
MLVQVAKMSICRDGYVLHPGTHSGRASVPSGAGELPPPQVDGMGIAAGEQAEHRGKGSPVRGGGVPGYGDVLCPWLPQLDVDLVRGSAI